MLVTTTKKVTTVENVPMTVEIQTPFFSKINQFGNWEYFAINESANGPMVSHLYLSDNFKNISIYGQASTLFGGELTNALEAKLIEAEEFFAVFESLIPKGKAIESLEQSNDNYERSSY